MREDAYFYTDHMTVGYNGRPLIREIEIRAARGEIVTLIGPNGGGKSTILKSITRQLGLVGGAVYLEGISMGQISGKTLSKKLAVVLTERIRPELMTCFDVVATGRYPYTGTLGILSPEDREKTEEAMKLVHALELRDCDFNAVSDGQRQRILLARAICQEPEMIVLDEPTSFLDIRHKLELLQILRQMVSQKHVAVILSLHELDLAQKISDFVICVHGEYIDRVGTPEEVFTSDYIQRLYGMTTGSYDAVFGSLEMERPKGAPEVFVIAGGGSGIPVFRQLSRSGTPFAAGVLHRNDVDYEVARSLATVLIDEEPFEPVSEQKVKKALEILERCSRVIYCLDRFGTMNRGNRKLLEEAGRRGLLAKA